MIVFPDINDLFIAQLLAPIPSYAPKREDKLGYRDYPIDTTSYVYDETLVNIADYDVAGQSYWTRPNSLLGKPLTDVEPLIYVRKSIAEKLHLANKIIQSPQITEIFGQKVELYVDNGIRAPKLQAFLYNIAFPEHIAKQNPTWDTNKVLKRRDNLIAKPPLNQNNPSPHMTGAAVDLTLRIKQANKRYVENVSIELLRASGATDSSCNPDYAENIQKPQNIANDVWATGKRNRRIMYNVLVYCGMQVNPTEMWHWSWGDQMWAKLQNKSAALYGTASNE